MRGIWFREPCASLHTYIFTYARSYICTYAHTHLYLHARWHIDIETYRHKVNLPAQVACAGPCTSSLRKVLRKQLSLRELVARGESLRKVIFFVCLTHDVFTRFSICMYVRMCFCSLACLFVCLFACLFVCLFVCMYVCMYVWSSTFNSGILSLETPPGPPRIVRRAALAGRGMIRRFFRSHTS